MAPRFLERFYERFIAAGPEVGAKFQGVNLKRQTEILRASLYHILRAAQGVDAGRLHLEDLGATHSRTGYDIGPELYDLWLNSLIEVAKEVDATFDASTELAWRFHLSQAIEIMLSQR